MDRKTKEALERFVEQMGLITQADGLPRIAGRLMGLMMIESGPFSFGQLSERLKISRGSVSTNTRLLENLGIIERVALPSDRQDYFQLAPNPHARRLEGVVHRMVRTRKLVAATEPVLPKEMKTSRKRLNELDEFCCMAMRSIQSLLKKYDPSNKDTL